jgi:hypothetical protein
MAFQISHNQEVKRRPTAKKLGPSIPALIPYRCSLSFRNSFVFLR